MLQEQYPYYLANRPQQPNADLAVTNKYSGEAAARVALADAAVLEQAIAAAADAAHRCAAWPPGNGKPCWRIWPRAAASGPRNWPRRS